MNQFLYSLFVLHFLNDGVRTAIISLLPFVTKELHLSFTQVGFLGSSQGVLTSALAIPTGMLSQRVGRFRLILYALFIYSLGTVIIGLSPNSIILTAAFYFGSIGFGMFHVVGFSLVSRLSEVGKKGRNLGNFTAIGDIGRITIPALAIFLVPFIGWRNSYIGAGILGIVVFLFFYFRVRKKIDTSHGEHNVKESHRDWLKNVALLLKRRDLLLILTAGVIDSIAANPVYIFLPFLLLSKGFSLAIFGVFTAAYYLGSFFGKSALGRSVDKYGNGKTFIFAEVFMGIALLLLVISHNLMLLLSIAFMLGLFTRGTTPVVTSLFSDTVHSDHYEKVFAVSEFSLGITAAIAPTFAGIFADRFGITTVYYVSAMLAFCAIIPVLFLPQTSKKK